MDIDGCMRIEDYEHSIKNALDIKQKMQARRGYCACYLSNDIGAYNSCPHLCQYCYANGNKELILMNYKNHDDNSPLLIGHLSPEDKVREAKQESYKKEMLLITTVFILLKTFMKMLLSVFFHPLQQNTTQM